MASAIMAPELLTDLRKVLEALRGCRTSDQVIQQAASLVQELTGWATVSLLRLDGSSSLLHVEATSGPQALPTGWQAPIDPFVPPEIRQANDTPAPWRLGADGPLRSWLPGLASALFLPLRFGERVDYVLCVGSNQADTFDEAAQRFALALGAGILLALQHVKVYAALERELLERQRVEDRLWATVKKTETLYRVSRSLISSRRFDEILQTVLRDIASALQSHRVVLLTFDLASRQLQSLVISGNERILPLPPFSQTVCGALQSICTGGWPLLLDQMECSTLLPLDALGLAGEDLCSAAIVPLFSQSQVSGVLMALNTSGQRTLTQQDVDLLIAIAGQIVSAIQNAELFQAINVERGRLRALVESSRDGVVLVGLDQRLLVVNQHALRLLGLPGTPEAWGDRSIWDALHALRGHANQLVKVVVGELRRLRAGDETPSEGECQVGSRVIQWLYLPVQGSEHSLGRLMVLRDVTEERLLEQLQEDLTRTMVHDLRNPLTGISVALKLLYQNPQNASSPDEREILEIAMSSAKHMAELVDAILDISRLESGQMPLHLTDFALAEAINSVLAVQMPLASQCGLQVQIEVPASLALVRADRKLIERVLDNLLSNAVKYTPPGGQLRITAAQDSTQRGKVCVSVSDTGSGIPQDIQERLFQKFVTGQRTGCGSGLGLAFCRMVLESHGERIWVAETSEKGSTFTFTLPVGK